MYNYTKDEKRFRGFQDICFHNLGNQNILSIALKNKTIFALFFALKCHINKARNDLLTNPSQKFGEHRCYIS